MAKLINVRERIDDMLMFVTPSERPLSPLGEPEGECDDGFVICAIASPPEKMWPAPGESPPGEVRLKPNELLRITVGDRVALAWPIDDLHMRWQRGVDTATVAALLSAYGSVPDRGRQRKLLRWLTEPGVVLDAGIIVPPRARVLVDTTGDTVVTAYLRGLRSREVG